jgi:hypothetical protein
MRKRFCDHTCRNRFHNGKQARRGPPVAPQGHDERQRTLERIYDELKSDIEDRGAMVGGRVNPAVEMLRKIGIELDRRAPAIEQEESDEPTSLIAV